jgi:hypothetical protein
MNKKYFSTVVLVLCLAVTAVAQQTAAPAAAADPATIPLPSVFDRVLTGQESQVVPAAEAMPADKFEFVPSGPGNFKDSRSFGAQVKHLAAVNYALAAHILGEKAPADYGTDLTKGPEGVKTKDEIVKFLKDSYAYSHKAMLSLTAENSIERVQGPFGGKMTRLGMASLMLSHPFDHYGQMVVYLRMNNIVPPATAAAQQQQKPPAQPPAQKD